MAAGILRQGISFLLQSFPASRLTAGALAFFILTQSGERAELQAESLGL
jgi:hypothetical protein